MEMGKPPLQATFDGAQGNRLHHRVDDAVARGRFHPDPVHERHHRTLAARIRRDHRRGGAGVGFRFAEPDADAVQPHAEIACRRKARTHVPGLRKLLRRHAEFLQAHAARVAEASLHRDPRPSSPIIVATVGLFVLVPKGFLPSDDTGQLFVFTEADQDVGFDEMARKHNEAAKIIRDDPAIAGVMAFIGVSGSSATLNVGRMIVTLKPRKRTRFARRRDPGTAAETAGHSRLQGVSAEHPDHPHRRPAHQDAIPVHAAGHRHEGTVRLRAETRRRGGEDRRVSRT